jgi:hypothetical protein
MKGENMLDFLPEAPELGNTANKTVGKPRFDRTFE